MRYSPGLGAAEAPGAGNFEHRVFLSVWRSLRMWFAPPRRRLFRPIKCGRSPCLLGNPQLAKGANLTISHRHRASIAAGWSRELFRALAAQETMVATRTLDYSVGQEWRSGGGTETVTGAGTGERVRGGGVKGTQITNAFRPKLPSGWYGQPGGVAISLH